MANSIVIISGPTASGKTDLALKLAAEKDIAIINADSLQIYEGLPTLSSQPSQKEKNQTEHFLYSHFKPNETSSVATWLKLLKPILERLWNENKTPAIVGGSGMYISKLVDGISEIPEISEEIRTSSRQLFNEIGQEAFKQKLLDLGEDEIIDKQRMLRAYEVLQQTGKSIFWWQQNPPKKLFPEAKFIHANLNPDREILYRNCNLRFFEMLKNGAVEEVESLIKQGAKDDWQITKTLGFVEIRDFLEQKIPRAKVVEIATQKTRNYAKRQLTWFRHQLPEKQTFSSSDSALNFLKNEI